MAISDADAPCASRPRKGWPSPLSNLPMRPYSKSPTPDAGRWRGWSGMIYPRNPHSIGTLKWKQDPGCNGNAVRAKVFSPACGAHQPYRSTW